MGQNQCQLRGVGESAILDKFAVLLDKSDFIIVAGNVYYKYGEADVSERSKIWIFNFGKRNVFQFHLFTIAAYGNIKILRLAVLRERNGNIHI